MEPQLRRHRGRAGRRLAHGDRGQDGLPRAPAAQEITVDWTTAPGTADETDFEAASGTLRFAPGEQTRQIRIALTGDGLPEADESFAILLSNPQGAELLDAEAIGLILNDDGGGDLLV